MMRLLIASLLVLARAQIPAGPNDVAICPVTGQNMTISAMYPLGLTGGQMLWFATKDAAAQRVPASHPPVPNLKVAPE